MGLAEYRVTAQGTSDVYKVEYMHAADGPLSSLSALDKHDAVCALCQAPDRQWSLMVPGRNDCPSGFVVDYSGHLMAETYNAAGPTQHVCVDDETEGIVDSETDSPSAGLYSVETGDGFGAAGGYIDNKEATCAQCSSDGGPAYVRWGRSSCPEAAKLVYAGLAAGSHYTGHTGGGYNFLCMHSEAAYAYPIASATCEGPESVTDATCTNANGDEQTCVQAVSNDQSFCSNYFDEDQHLSGQIKS